MSGISVSGASVTVNLTGVINAQRITVTLRGVNDGTTFRDISVPMGVLLGDTNGNGVVSSTDILLVKSKVGQPVDGTNFRLDVNANGVISATDVSITKSQAGIGLP